MRGFRRRWIAGVVAGLALCGAPLLGALGTVVGLLHSFGAVSGAGVDPAEKSALLANGISAAMWSTAIGLGLLPAGAVLLGVSLWRLVATRRVPTRV